MTACADREIPATVAITVSPETLDCDDYELVEVIEVIDANTVLTSNGDIQLYGAFSLKQPADCASQAEDRLRALADDQIRIQPCPTDSVRRDDDHYYLLGIKMDSISAGFCLKMRRRKIQNPVAFGTTIKHSSVASQMNSVFLVSLIEIPNLFDLH
jgi:hypothetical protein